MLKNSAYTLILAVLILISLGLVMIMSVGPFAVVPQDYIKKQVIFFGVSLVACVVASHWDYHHWIKFSWIAIIGVIVLMAACFLPIIGHTAGGGTRWIRLGPVGLQPSEFAKIGLIAFLAWWLTIHVKQIKSFKYGFLIPVAVFGAIAVMGGLQKDLGLIAILLALTVILLFIAGSSLKYISLLPILGGVGIVGVALYDPSKLKRIKAFLNPEKYAADAAYQGDQAMIAFGSGGMDGIGVGKSIQKMKYLPESHTDFIFPILGEELGLIFTLIVVFCFIIVALSGGFISCHAPDRIGLLLGLGITSMISVQACINMAVATGLMPVTGLSLPFLSYGGSNLLLCLVSIGILLNIHRQAIYAPSSKTDRGFLPPVMSARM